MDPVSAMGDSDDIVKEFVVESYENLDRLDQELVVLEKDPANRDILASIFRTIHTIKGTSGFLAFDKLGSLTHAGENLLGLLRDGQLLLDGEITNALLAMVDAVRQMLANIENTGSEGERDDSVLITELKNLQSGDKNRGKQSGVSADSTPAKPSAGAEKLAEGPNGPPRAKKEAVKSQSTANAVLPPPSVPSAGASSPGTSSSAKTTSGDTAENHPSQSVRGPSVSDSTIRLDVALLDQLMNLVGELVLARNQILQFASSTEEGGLLASSQRLNLITSELQEGVMKTRMQPIGNIWSKLPRTVRDLALACGKQVRVEMEGQETELDKTLIEAIKDPLTHIVRNSVDHGIERSEIRQSRGKNPEGRLALRAFHEGGQVNIEISDDGAGLDAERIRNKAIQKGLISSEQAARLNDRELVNLVFLPGFSTAETVTNVSGRGVGMDVVKTHIEKIGGVVELQSKPGQGVMVRMKIPLTLAIIPALIVNCAEQPYAVPQTSLLELVRLESGADGQTIETIHGVPVYRLRGRLLPLVHLRSQLQERSRSAAGSAFRQKSDADSDSPTADADQNGEQLNAVNIVVLEAEGRRFGLVVDEITDTQEIVVKPLGQHLKNLNIYAGATIMGDGKVALILDVLGLAERGGVLSEEREHLVRQADELAKDEKENKQKLVLFTGRAGSQMAVPLDLLARLENVPGERIERSGNQWVTQYRGQILPLIRVTHALEERRRDVPLDDILSLPTSGTLQVLVLENEQQAFGLIVNQILDIVESNLRPQSPATRSGVLYSTVIGDKVTELLDVPVLLRSGETFEPAAIV